MSHSFDVHSRTHVSLKGTLAHEEDGSTRAFLVSPDYRLIEVKHATDDLLAKRGQLVTLEGYIMFSNSNRACLNIV